MASNIDTCHYVKGIKGQSGLIHYCASYQPAGEEEKITTKWCHEKLVSIDPAVRCFSYEILENNIGFKSYLGTIKVLPPTTKADVDGEVEYGCEIEWSFLCDPVDGLTCEIFSSFLNNSLQGVAENIEKSFAINV